MVRQLDRIVEIGTETPSSGPSAVCSSLPCLLFSVLFPPGCVSWPLLWGPRALGKEAGAGPLTDADLGLQLGLQLEVLEAVGGGEDWPGDGRMGHRGPRGCLPLSVPHRLFFLSSGLLSSLCWVLRNQLGIRRQRAFTLLWQVDITSCLWIMEGKSAASSQHQAPESQGCFFLSFQPYSLFSKQDLLQNHKLGDCSEVESIFIPVSEDLGVINSQMYWMTERRPGCRTF